MNRVQQGMRASTAHTDDWLITYADMITLLLCFFVIFFVILYSKKNGHDEAVAAGALASTMHDARPAHPRETLTEAAQPDRQSLAPNALENAGTSLSDQVTATIGAPSRARPNSATDDGLAAVPAGDRISMLEISSSAFFDSGSADLSDSGKSILRGVAVELKSSQYQGYHIVVEGHTDDTPIATARFSSNWELSTARAAAVVHFFLDQGLPAQKLHAAGYADTQPKAPNRDADGNAIPENQAQNRRVVIRLEKIETPD